MEKEELTKLFSNDKEELLSQGIMFIEGEFDTELANKFRIQLFTIIELGIRRITIFINSYGGSVYDFLSMYGMLKSFKDIHLTTIINGYAMSAGAYFACLGDERKATEGSRIMFHELSTGTIGKLNEITTDHEESKELQKFLYKIVEKVIKDKDFNIAKWLEKDQYLNINQAHKMGVLTKRKFAFNMVPVEQEEQNDTQTT